MLYTYPIEVLVATLEWSEATGFFNIPDAAVSYRQQKYAMKQCVRPIHRVSI